jgi:type III pantothenate kinase
MILIAIGNTHTQIAHTEDGRDFRVERRPSGAAITKLLAGLPSPWSSWLAEEPIYLGGVVPEREALWRACLASGQIRDWDPERFHALLPNAYEPPQSLGFDRRCCLLAAARDWPDRNLLVVDAGTAITLDLLAGGRFHGGRILPGLGLSLRALAQHTAQLPTLCPQSCDMDFGNSTQECLLLGVTAGAAAAVDAALRDGRRRYPDLGLLLTGGDAPLLQARLGQGELVPNLLLRGFFLLTSAT